MGIMLLYFVEWHCSLASYNIIIDLLGKNVLNSKFTRVRFASIRNCTPSDTCLLDNYSTINGNTLLKFLATPLTYIYGILKPL